MTKQSHTDTQLKLKPGDFIETEVQRISKDGALAYPTPWQNITKIKIVGISRNTTLRPGSNIYATVKRIQNGVAELKQERGVYKRHHLPGDTIVVETETPVGKHLSRGTTDDPRNLDQIYVIDVGPNATLRAYIEKVRDGIAFVSPTEILEEGFSPGHQLMVETHGDSTHAQSLDGDVEVDVGEWIPIRTEIPVEISNINDPLHAVVTDHEAIPQEGDLVPAKIQQGHTEASLQHSPCTVQLERPAIGTGVIDVRLITLSSSKIEGRVTGYPTDTPEVGEEVEATAIKTNSIAEIEQDGITFEVQLEHDPPLTGTVIIRITDVDGTSYQGKITEYTAPSLQPGNSVQARISKRRQEAQTKINGNEIRIELNEEVSGVGEATVQIDEINESIVGHIVGEVEFVHRKPDGPDIDLTDVGKF